MSTQTKTIGYDYPQVLEWFDGKKCVVIGKQFRNKMADKILEEHGDCYVLGTNKFMSISKAYL